MHVMPKPGVTDPEAESALALLRDLDYAVSNVRTIRTYRIEGPAESLPRLISRVLANDAVELAVTARCRSNSSARAALSIPARSKFRSARSERPGSSCDLSRSGQLALGLAEMKTIQRPFRRARRDPTDCELETLAQTWSEHCSHKTLRGRISFRRAND